MTTLLATIHVIAWSIYVGGAITMEFILRYAQRTMPPSQIGVVCKRAGSRYRWVALATLGVIGASGLAMVLDTGDTGLRGRLGDPRLSLGDAYDRTLLLLTIAWTISLFLVSLMAFRLHPAQSKRVRQDMTQDEVATERQRIGRAIHHMEITLRAELVTALIAMAFGASLHAGGLF